MEHLDLNLQLFLKTATDDQRIEFAKKYKWIGYTQSQQIFNKFEDLLKYPKTYRMPNLLLVGDSNNGKTAILRKFTERNPAYIREQDSQLINPVLYIQAPPDPDEKRFYNIILDTLFSPTRTSEKIESRQARVIALLTKLEVKLLMIDEIQHVLAGSMKKQRLFLNVIKYLSNELQVPIVCSGTREAFNAIQTDVQLANRFEPRVLKRWENDDELKRLLISFERIIPLKSPSYLFENSIMKNILNKSEGLIGEISKILEIATIYCIRNKKEKIDNQILNQIDYIAPINRKKSIYF